MGRASRQQAVILMADDDEDDFLLVKNAFQENGFRVDLRFAADGNELLSYLHHCGKKTEFSLPPCPDLILLDLNMPKMDGRQALKRIKSDPKLRDIPIVVLTTSKEEEDIRYCYDLGACSFLVKPKSFDELVQAMDFIAKYWFELVELPR